MSELDKEQFSADLERVFDGFLDSLNEHEQSIVVIAACIKLLGAVTAKSPLDKDYLYEGYTRALKMFTPEADRWIKKVN